MSFSKPLALASLRSAISKLKDDPSKMNFFDTISAVQAIEWAIEQLEKTDEVK